GTFRSLGDRVRAVSGAGEGCGTCGVDHRGAWCRTRDPCDRVHPLPLCLLTGGRVHRRGPCCAATSTSDSSSGHAPSTLSQYGGTSTTGTTGRWRGSSTPATAYSGGVGCS